MSWSLAAGLEPTTKTDRSLSATLVIFWKSNLMEQKPVPLCHRMRHQQDSYHLPIASLFFTAMFR
jgi:hypothetical protein